MAKRTLLTAGKADPQETVTDAGEYAEMMEEYGIDPTSENRWKGLAKTLAEKLHKNPKGRPFHKSKAYFAFLLSNVEHHRNFKGLNSDKASLEMLYDYRNDLLVGPDRAEYPPTFDSLDRDLKKARELRREGKIAI